MESPELFNYARTGNAPEKRHFLLHHQHQHQHHSVDLKTGDNFIIEDLLDFSNEDSILLEGSSIDGIGAIGTPENITNGGNSTESSTVTAVDSCNSSISGSNDTTNNFPSDQFRDFPEAHFSNDLCVPYDDLAELEWLSNIGEETFSSEDLQKLHLISGMQARPEKVSEPGSEIHEFPPEPNRVNPIFDPEMSVPAKARSKRSRAAPCDWSSRLLVLSPTTSSAESDTTTTNSEKKKIKIVSRKKLEVSENSSGEGRRCMHCATDKTPQWRTGPLGPKTLCNACGVRYKSGRLVPEYRPAASPTFVMAKHSNSHRKVMELRRQKEMQMSQQYLYPNTAFEVPMGDDCLIHHHTGPDFRQLI